VLWRRGVLRARAGRLTGAADDLSAALQLNCGHGDVAVRASTLLAYLQYLLGQWTAARLTADQAIGLALTRGTTSSYVRAYAVAACVAASSGALDRAEGLLRTSRRWSRAAGRASDVLYPAVAGAVLAQAAGDHPAMLAAIEPLSGPPGGEDLWWWPLRAEALIGAGHLDEAAKELSGVTAESVPPSLRAGHAWLAGWLARLRGDLDAALSLYAGALDGGSEPGADDIPLLRARLEHAYGSLLLARRSRRAAVHWLRAARERYRALGAAPFLARCDTELASWGLRAVAAGPGPYGPRNVLSAQEGRVARLVAQGMTNQEVARRLYVSPKTVEFHLSNVFTKLGIASRRQLRPGMLEPLRA
jgi:DNA-binding CsgD family transcriptional regulator/tetratricopeptide (TPR) repeat protein